MTTQYWRPPGVAAKRPRSLGYGADHRGRRGMVVECAAPRVKSGPLLADRSTTLVSMRVCHRVAPASGAVHRAGDTSPAHRAPCPRRRGAAELSLLGWDSHRDDGYGGGQSVEWSFDTVHHRLLLRGVRRRIVDQRFLALLWKLLKAGCIDRGLFRATSEGVPQGGVSTPWTQKITFVGSIILRGSDRTGWASVATGKSRGGWDRMANGDAVISDHDLLDEQSGNALTISYIEGLSIAVQTRQERR